MLRCVNFLETPDSGTVNVCGEIINCSDENLKNLVRIYNQKLL